MNKQNPLIDKNGEVRELTTADFLQFRPAKDILPPELFNALVTITLRLPPVQWCTK